VGIIPTVFVARTSVFTEFDEHCPPQNSGAGLRIPIKPYNMSLVNRMTKFAEDGWELAGHCGALSFNRSVARIAQSAGLDGFRPSTRALNSGQFCA
jgi:hypothetical protein